MFSCFTMYAICQPALDTRKQFVIHRIVSLTIINHLCFPLQGVWAKLPQSLTNVLLPFLVTNGTPHIQWLWDGSWLRCSLGFSLLRSSLMCLRGSRSSSGSPGVPSSVDLAVAEGHLATNDVWTPLLLSVGLRRCLFCRSELFKWTTLLLNQHFSYFPPSIETCGWKGVPLGPDKKKVVSLHL